MFEVMICITFTACQEDIKVTKTMTHENVNIKSFITRFYVYGLESFGYLLFKLNWLAQTCIQTFHPLISIVRSEHF